MADKERNKTLHLTLKHKWFDMIKEGKKTCEYRDLRRWIYRLVFKDKIKGNLSVDEMQQKLRNAIKEMHDEMQKRHHDMDSVAKCIISFGFEDRSIYRYDYVCFHRGYSRTALTYPIRKIYMGEGDTKLGAEEGKLYVIIDFSKDQD